MSTKIYSAFKFRGVYEDLIPFLSDVRKKVKEETLSYLSNMKKIPPYSEFRNLVKEDLEIQSSVCVYLHGKEIYLQFFLPGLFGRYSRKNQEILDLWQDRMTDFHYQDQVDKPDDISDDEYSVRKEVWNEIFNLDCRPGYAGFVWNLLGDSDIMTIWCDLQK